MIFVSNCPALADERLALFIFVRARRLADEHELRVNAADAEHDRLARRREVRAFHAGQRALAQRGKGGGLCLRIERRGAWAG